VDSSFSQERLCVRRYLKYCFEERLVRFKFLHFAFEHATALILPYIQIPVEREFNNGPTNHEPQNHSLERLRNILTGYLGGNANEISLLAEPSNA